MMLTMYSMLLPAAVAADMQMRAMRSASLLSAVLPCVCLSRSLCPAVI
jgi:hypothetical protein